jgi:glycosyltransferase involved in cell wall biosynthesis
MTERILVFARSTPHHRAGGMETQAWSLAAEWARLGVQVTLVTTAIEGARGPFGEDGIDVVPLAQTKPGRYSRSWWEASNGYWLSVERAPEVVFSVSAGAYSVVRSRSRHPHTGFVMQAHGTAAMELESKLSSRSLRSLATTPKNAKALLTDLARYRDFDQIIAVGERVYDSLTGKLLSRAATPERVRLIQNGVALSGYGFDPLVRKETRAALGLTDDIVAVGCIGRLHSQKRLDRSLRAASVLRERGLGDRFRFLLVGDGPDEERLRGLAKELELGQMIHFVGPVDREAVRAYYSASDISVLTTAWLEGLPMAVLEALACGLPCVVTQGSVAAKALYPLLHQVDTADAGMLAEVLLRAAESPAERISLLPSDFQLEQCARHYLSAFAELSSAAKPIGHRE